MTNILTVDCEDWCHTRISQKYLNKHKNVHCEDRIVSTVTTLLDLLGTHGARATFFVLGAVAEKFPALIKRIEKAGHRIGCHGYSHTDIFLKNESEFEREVDTATTLLNNLVSRPVESFRAPNWSINGKSLWALKILKKYGYKYDSSLTTLVKSVNRSSEDSIIEIPRSTARIYNFNIPFGGAFLRLYPFTLTISLMRRLNQRGLPFMVYIHPWEIDAEIPFLRTSPADWIVQYCGISGNLIKIKALLNNFNFTSIEDFFDRRNLSEKFLNELYFLA